jgi:hypothetical protein
MAWEKDGGYSPYTLNIKVEHGRSSVPALRCKSNNTKQMRFPGTTVQPLGRRNRMNNCCGIGASFSAVSTWIAGLSQAGLIAERRPGFPKAIK